MPQLPYGAAVPFNYCRRDAGRRSKQSEIAKK